MSAAETRRVMILCKSPACIVEAKKNYKPSKKDEEHYFYNCSEALDWLLIESAVGSPPDLIVVDLENKRCQGHLLFLKAKRIAPSSFVLGISPSQKNQP